MADKKNRLFLVPCLIFFTAASTIEAAQGQAACKKLFSADGQTIVKLSGHLINREVWGPPNFGEHPDKDEKISVWIIELDQPVIVEINADIGLKPEKITVGEIQIKRRLGSAHGYDDFLRAHVVVTGNLQTQTEYDDTTPVVLDSEVVRLGGKIGCDGSESPPKI
jgi:hypothetical protein